MKNEKDATPQHQVQAGGDAVAYELRMISPNGNMGQWHRCDEQMFIKFQNNGDIGGGFKYEARALYATPPSQAPALPATGEALTDEVAWDLIVGVVGVREDERDGAFFAPIDNKEEARQVVEAIITALKEKTA